MDLFIVITPDPESVSEDTILSAKKEIEKNLSRAIFFSRKPVGTEKVFIYSEKFIGVEFCEHTERLILDFYKLGKGSICAIEQMSFEEVITPNVSTMFAVVRESQIESLLKQLSKDLGETYKEFLLGPLEHKEKLVSGEVVFVGNAFDNVFATYYLSEYDLLDTFNIEGQFKSSAISTGRSALEAYLRMKDAGKDFSKELKENMKTGLKKLHTSLGKFIENIDK